MSESPLDFSFRMSYLKDWRDRQHLPPRPPRFSPSSHLEQPLGADLHTDLGSVGTALGARGSSTRSHTFGQRELATLAHYSLGLMRYEPTDPYPIHRPAPSPRCLHASELYYVPRDASAPLQRYHPIRHTLEPVPRQWISSDALGTDALGGWLITVQPDRVAFLYGQYAHRLALLEAGHVMAQLRCLARGFGWDTRIHRLPFELPHTTSTEIPLAVLEHTTGTTDLIDDPLPSAMQRPLHTVMLNRHSGHGKNGVDPLPIRLRHEDLLTMARFATANHEPDLEIGLELHAVVMNVDGLPVGAYRYAPHTGFQLLRPLDHTPELHRLLFYTPGFKVQHCPVVWFVAADLPRAARCFGAAAYAHVQTAVGQLAHRLELAAAAHDLFARPSLSYQEAKVDRLLRLHVRRGSAMLSVLIGKDRELGFPIRLSL